MTYCVWCTKHYGNYEIIKHDQRSGDSFIPLACAECDDSLPLSEASSIPLCYVLYPATLLHQLLSILSHLILPSISWSTSQFLVPKFIYNTLLRILFSSILCTCPNQHNLFNLIVSIIVGFFNYCVNSFIG